MARQMETAISCYALLAQCNWTIEPIIEDEDNVIPVIGERGLTGVPQRGQIRIQLWWWWCWWWWSQWWRWIGKRRSCVVGQAWAGWCRRINSIVQLIIMAMIVMLVMMIMAMIMMLIMVIMMIVAMTMMLVMMIVAMTMIMMLMMIRKRTTLSRRAWAGWCGLD